MFTKKEFLKQAQAIKILEERAEKRYADLINELSDAEIIKILNPIKEDEQKHQRIIQDIIDIIMAKEK